MRFGRKITMSNVGGVELIRASAPAGIDLGGDGVDALTIDIECAQKIDRVELQAWLDPIERVSCHKEGAFHGAVVSPEANRVPRRVVAAAMVGKVDGHIRGLLLLRLPWKPHHSTLAGTATALLEVAAVSRSIAAPRLSGSTVSISTELW
jgi:hypothetical protein